MLEFHGMAKGCVTVPQVDFIMREKRHIFCFGSLGISRVTGVEIDQLAPLTLMNSSPVNLVKVNALASKKGSYED